MESLSVIIPVYNAAPWIEACIRSVVSQVCDCTPEIIIVDDGSTDNTPDIISRFKNIARVITLQHSGQAYARNTAIKHSSGKCLMFVDADDMLSPGAIYTLAKIMNATGAPIACAPLSRRHHAISGEPHTEIFDSHTAVEKLLYQTNLALNSSLGGKIFDRRIFNEIRFWDNHLYEDLEIMPRLFLRAGSIAVTSSPLYFYRRNPLSTLSVWCDRRKDMIDVVQRIITLPEIETDPILYRAAADRCFSAACNCLINMWRHNDNDTATIARCRSILKNTRRSSLFNPRARLKNRLTAAALSLLPL
jgi:glycosyltransferase involved in cell wall biosynthesis